MPSTILAHIWKIHNEFLGKEFRLKGLGVKDQDSRGRLYEQQGPSKFEKKKKNLEKESMPINSQSSPSP